MKGSALYISLLLLLLTVFDAVKAQHTHSYGLLPAPVSVVYGEGSFLPDARTAIVAHHIRAVSYKNGKQVGREINLQLSELQKRITQ